VLSGGAGAWGLGGFVLRTRWRFLSGAARSVCPRSTHCFDSAWPEAWASAPDGLGPGHHDLLFGEGFFSFRPGRSDRLESWLHPNPVSAGLRTRGHGIFMAATSRGNPRRSGAGFGRAGPAGSDGPVGEAGGAVQVSDGRAFIRNRRLRAETAFSPPSGAFGLGNARRSVVGRLERRRLPFESCDACRHEKVSDRSHDGRGDLAKALVAQSGHAARVPGASCSARSAGGDGTNPAYGGHRWWRRPNAKPPGGFRPTGPDEQACC